MTNDNHLLFFYGDGCPHCKRMEVHLDKLESDHGVKVSKHETWNNEDNIAFMETLDKEPCGGVPFFCNTKTGKTICGEASFEEVQDWADCK